MRLIFGKVGCRVFCMGVIWRERVGDAAQYAAHRTLYVMVGLECVGYPHKGDVYTAVAVTKQVAVESVGFADAPAHGYSVDSVTNPFFGNDDQKLWTVGLALVVVAP